MKKPIITIKDMSVVYNEGKPTEFVALNNINLDIYPEEYVVFFGPSGSGKSTLLYVIAGLETPASGQVLIRGGKDITSLSEKELIEYHKASVGMVFQAFYLIPSLSAEENISMPMMFSGQKRALRPEVVEPLMDRFGITAYKDRTPSRLSGGQQQRVAIARSLVNDPPVILADEPVGNLDSTNAETVLELISNLNKRDKKTVIMVTHNPAHLSHADRVFHLKDGAVTHITVNNNKREYLERRSLGGAQGAEAARTSDPRAWIAQKKDSELLHLAEVHPALSEHRLRSKLMLNYLLDAYDFRTLHRIELLAEAFLQDKITETELEESLDESYDKGGVSLYSQTAKKVARQISQLAQSVGAVEKTSRSMEDNALSSIKQEVIRQLLLDYKGDMSPQRLHRLGQMLEYRITDRIGADDFLRGLDMPLKEGGAGLNRRTAEKFARKAEVILMNVNLSNRSGDNTEN